MRKTLILASTAIALTFSGTRVLAQSEPGKVELGGHFTSITKSDFGGTTQAGFGGRFTFNFHRSIAVEAEGNFFPHNCGRCRAENPGALTQGLFGIKAGRRFRKFGVFGKARPGIASSSSGVFDVFVQQRPPGIFPIVTINRSRANNFAFDVGGVVELYHSRHLFTRFDGGDTIIRYSQRTTTAFFFDPVTGIVTPLPIVVPGDTRHNFQFSAGIGIRF